MSRSTPKGRLSLTSVRPCGRNSRRTALSVAVQERGVPFMTKLCDAFVKSGEPLVRREPNSRCSAVASSNSCAGEGAHRNLRRAEAREGRGDRLHRVRTRFQGSRRAAGDPHRQQRAFQSFLQVLRQVTQRVVLETGQCLRSPPIRDLSDQPMAISESALRRLPPDVLAGEGCQAPGRILHASQGGAVHASIRRMGVHDLAALTAG
jgi:hypothetical protein